jgi:hypothetical protein
MAIAGSNADGLASTRLLLFLVLLLLLGSILCLSVLGKFLQRSEDDDGDDDDDNDDDDDRPRRSIPQKFARSLTTSTDGSSYQYNKPLHGSFKVKRSTYDEEMTPLSQSSTEIDLV